MWVDVYIHECAHACVHKHACTSVCGQRLEIPKKSPTLLL